MIEIRPLLDARELRAIHVQRSQASIMLSVTGDDLDAVVKAGPGFVGYSNGIPIGAAGLAVKWRGSAVGWALLAGSSGEHFLSIHRHAKRVLDLSEFERIECHVEKTWVAAHRWARMLDFHSEGLMEKFRDGHDYRLYSRIR